MAVRDLVPRDLPEQSAPSTPASGYGRLYVDSNGRPRFINDGGIDRRLDLVPRVVTLTDAATVTPNADTTDVGILTSLSQTTTMAAPTGTPEDGQRLQLRIKSSTARSLTWNSAYRFGTDITSTMYAATSGGSLTDYIGFQYNSADSKWDCIALARGY